MIFGTGSITEEIIAFVERYDLYEIIAYTLDKAFIKDSKYHGKPVYPFEELEDHVDIKDVYVFVAISWIQKMNKYKKEKFLNLKERGFRFANLISPKCSIYSKDIGEGNWIEDFVYIGFNTVIGSNNVFLPSSTIEHHTIIGDHNFFGQSSSVAGSTVIGDLNYVGANATVFNKLTIGAKNVIGAGTVIKHRIDNYKLCVQASPFIKECDEYSIENYIDINRMIKQ